MKDEEKQIEEIGILLRTYFGRLRTVQNEIKTYKI